MLTSNERLIMSKEEKQERVSLQDSLPAFASPPPPPVCHLHCSKKKVYDDHEAQVHLLFVNIRAGASPSQPDLPAERRGRVLVDHAVQTCYICSASELIGHRVLKMAVLFFLCACPLTVQSKPPFSAWMRVCACV